jgi:hypothetical protein
MRSQGPKLTAPWNKGSLADLIGTIYAYLEHLMI